MEISRIECINRQQLHWFSTQVNNCPANVAAMTTTFGPNGYTSDAMLFSNWRPWNSRNNNNNNMDDKHYFGALVLEVQQKILKKKVKMPNGAPPQDVTNIYLVNKSMAEVQMSAWEPFSDELFRVEIGKVSLNLCPLSIQNSMIK